MSSASFEPEGSSSGRVYIYRYSMVWYALHASVGVSNTLFYLLDCLLRLCTMYHTITAYKTVFLKKNSRVRNM